MSWNKRVLDLMNERNINQKQLSHLSGINEISISRYLHSGQQPRMDVVVNIAKALQLVSNTCHLIRSDFQMRLLWPTVENLEMKSRVD